MLSKGVDRINYIYFQRQVGWNLNKLMKYGKYVF